MVSQWPIMTTICPNHMYALSIIHIFVNLSSSCIILLTKPSTSRWSQEVLNQSLFTRLLKFSSKLCALIYEHFYWNTKSTQDPIQICINSPLITFVPKWSQLKLCGKMFDHNNTYWLQWMVQWLNKIKDPSIPKTHD